MMHGYFEFSGHANLGAALRHTAAQGNVVVYPRWQTGPHDPCPGSFDITGCEVSAVNGIKGALDFLRDHRTSHVQPRLAEASYIAHSFGAVLTVNVSNKHREYGIPRPRALWLDEPDDSGLSGEAEGALDDDLIGIPSDTKVVCLAGADGTTSPTQHVNLLYGYRKRACNVLFPMLGHIPAANKSLIMNYADNYGTPALTAPHGVCAGDRQDADTYDWSLCWRSMDAVRTCALYDVDCEYALGDTPQNRHTGTWSDGTPVIGLKIQDTPSIRKDPVPGRQPAPPPESFAAPDARFGQLRAAYSAAQPLHVLRGTAFSRHGVTFVRVAVVKRTTDGCEQLTPAGRLVPLRRCNRPTELLWGEGGERWRIKLPTGLPRGQYRATVLGVDSYGSGQTRATRAGTHDFRVR